MKEESKESLFASCNQIFQIKLVKLHSLMENCTHQFQLMARYSKVLSGTEVISFITHSFMVFRNPMHSEKLLG